MATAYAPPTTIADLKQYVQAAGAMQAAAESTVLMFITHNHLKAQFPEIRLDRHVSSRPSRQPQRMRQHGACAVLRAPAAAATGAQTRVHRR